jgi:glycerol-3-phosphate acyltransferase PlsY
VFSFNEYLFFASSYLIGSIPFGLIVAKLAGIGDITTQGSGNIGATNVMRVGGKRLGVIVFLLDFLKSFIPTTAYMLYFGPNDGVLICAILAVIGHILPIFNKFKGGKGVATGFGAIMAINIIVGVFALLLWLVCYLVTRISSASALFAFALMPFAFLFSKNINIMIFAIALSLIIYARHIDNIKRLLNGQEKKI